jgi:peptide/nickel transport system permease protein
MALAEGAPPPDDVTGQEPPTDDPVEARRVLRSGFVRSMPWSARIAVLWMLFIVLSAVFADVLPLQNPNVGITAGNRPNLSPSAEHLLGTDNNSRDLFARLIYGARVSLTVSATAVGFGLVFGGFFGAMVGYVRGKTETVVMATIDVILAFPGLVLLLALIAFLQSASLFAISLVIGFLSIPPYTRVSRANTLSIARREFVTAAEAIGTRRTTILFREIIPNVLPSLVAYALVASAAIIVLEGSLAFLGLSVQPPTATWGAMINEGRQNMKQNLLPVIFPSLAMLFTVLSLNTIGDWMRKRNAYRSAAL